MPIYTLVDGEEVRAQGLRWSNTDPGGFDAASFTTERVPEPGAPVRVLDGLGELFGGHVEEPGRRQERGRESANVQAVGHADLLKRNPYSMVYMDRGLGEWRGPSNDRVIALNPSFDEQAASEVRRDATSPGLVSRLVGAWARGARTDVFYDAGPENTIAAVRATYDITGGFIDSTDANWTWALDLWATDGVDAVTDQQAGALLRSSGVSSAAGETVATSRDRRYASIRHSYGTAAGTADARYEILWRYLRVIGDHGLPILGDTAETEGVSPSDVLEHALFMSGARFEARITPHPMVLPHLVYRDTTAPLQVATDLGKITAWHWGVWEPASCLSHTPTLLFQPPPPAATAAVRYQDCINPEIVEKLADMHDELILRWGDPAGDGGVERVKSAHPRPGRAIRGLPLELDGGTLATEAVAEALASTYLFLDQVQSRASGQATLPAALLDGRPAHHLKSGRDRLELVGLPTTAPLIADPPARPGAFRVKRVEVTVDDNSGVPTTQVQFDAGADLIEALNARLGIASTLAGG